MFANCLPQSIGLSHTGEVNEQVPVVSRGQRPRWWPPLVLLALVPLVAGVSLANAAELMPAPVGFKASGVEGAPPERPVDVILAPTLSADPAPETYIQQIEIILPPPPPPPPTVGRKRAGSGVAPSQAAASGMTYVQWCNAGGGASASASSISGLLAAANAERAQWGFAALTWSDSLAGQAQSRSQTMANDHTNGGFNLSTQEGFEHFKANRATWDATVFRHSGLGAENIYFGIGSGKTGPTAAHVAWMTSAGHCKGLLNPNHRYFGAGSANAADGSYFATQRFS